MGLPGRLSANRTQLWLVILGLLWLVLAGAIYLFELREGPYVRIEWATETEFNTAGFNIYRSQTADGPFSQINEQLIPSQADPASGAMYKFVDRNVEPGLTYYYRLEDVEYDNTREQHEIFSGRAQTLDLSAAALAVASVVVGLYLLYTGLRPAKPRSSP